METPVSADAPPASAPPDMRRLARFFAPLAVQAAYSEYQQRALARNGLLTMPEARQVVRHQHARQFVGVQRGLDVGLRPGPRGPVVQAEQLARRTGRGREQHVASFDHGGSHGSTPRKA